MGLVRYTHEQLLSLRESPLIHKPDGLPSIAQWMEVPQNEQKDRKQVRQQQGRGDDQEGGEATTQRNIFQTRQMGKGVISPDELGLGKFTAPRRNQDTEKTLSPGEEGVGRMSNGRWTRDRDANTKRDKDGLLSARDTEKDDGEGWTNVRPRKSFGHEDGERWQRNGDRNRDRFQRNAEGDQDTRRSGAGRGRFDKPWHRDDAGAGNGELEPRATGRPGGWRDRERRDDREWTRGGRMESRVDDNPEWMDEAVEDEPAQARTAADMEQFKQMMKDQASGRSAKPAGDSPADKSKDSPFDSKTTTPLTAVDSGRLFGMWGEPKKLETGGNNGGGPFKAAPKAKASKFSSFFGTQKEEEAPEPLEPISAISPHGTHQKQADREGFDRILAMLGGTNISTPSTTTAVATPPAMPSHTPVDLQRLDNRQREMRHQHDSRDEQAMFFEQLVSQPPPQKTNQHPPGLPPQQDQFSGPEVDFFTRGRVDNAPSRNGATSAKESAGPFGPPETQSARKMDPNHEFLLKLMQSRATPPQRQDPMSPPIDLNNAFVFPENKAPRQTQQQPQQPKMRAPPPGFFDERQYLFDERQYLFDERQYVEQQQRARDVDNMPELGRKSSQRGAAPPGMFDDAAMAQLQRRNTTEAISRAHQQQQHMTNMNMARQMPPQIDEFFMKGQPPPGMRPPNMPEGVGMPHNMRLPPGFGPPPPGPPPNMPHTVGSTPLGHPGLQQHQRGPPSAGPGPMSGMFPHGMQPPQTGGPPPGYFGGPVPGAPPGFGGPMGPPGGMGMHPGAQQQGRGRGPFDMLSEMGIQGRGPGGRGGMPF